MYFDLNLWNRSIISAIVFFGFVSVIVLVVKRGNKGQFQAKCGHIQHKAWNNTASMASGSGEWKLVYTPEWIKTSLNLTRKQRICNICMENMKKPQHSNEVSQADAPSLSTASSYVPPAPSLPEDQVEVSVVTTEPVTQELTQGENLSTSILPSPVVPSLPPAHSLSWSLTPDNVDRPKDVPVFHTEPVIQISVDDLCGISQQAKLQEKSAPLFVPNVYQDPPTHQFPKAPKSWFEVPAIASRVYMKLKLVMNHDPAIIKTVTINSDGSWLVRIFGKEIDLRGQFPEILPRAIMGGLIDYVDNLNLCSGNPDPRYVEMARLRNGQFPKASWEQQVVDDPITQDVHTSTIRHHSCPLILNIGKQCNECGDYSNSLRSMFSRSLKSDRNRDARTSATSKTPMSYLSSDELLRRAKDLSKALKSTRESMTRLLRKTIEQEVTTKGVDIDDEQLSASLKEVMTSDLKNQMKDHPSDSFGHLFWQQQLKALNTDDPRGYRWHPMIIKWCLNLKMASSKAYDILRNTIKLPNQQTLRRYVHWTDPKSGFTVDAAKLLSQEVSKFPKDHQKYAIIVHDEMKIRSDLVYNKHTGKLQGFVDLGSWENQMKDFENHLQKENEPEKNLAKYLFVMQVRCLFYNFSFPLAHFPTANLKAHEIFSVFWKAVEVCELAGLKIVGVTCDGAATNRRFLNMHGNKGSSTKPIFQVPMPYRHRWSEDHGRKLFLLVDPPHLIKCVRNAWWNKARMLWNFGNIMWKQLEDLYYMDTEKGDGGLHLTKLTYEHVELTSYSKMKVGLAAETLSTSVANALELCQGESVKATVEFVRMFDKFFDLLNIRSTKEAIRTRKEDKNPYKSVDDHRLTWLENDFIGYLDNWAKAVEERDPGKYTTAERKKMLIPEETSSGLRRTACGFAALTRYLLQIPGVEFVLSEKINQDKLEQLFGNVRQMKGGNESPSIAEVNSTMNVLRLKTSQDLKIMRGNTYNKKTIDELEVDDSPLPCKISKRK